MTFGIRGLLCSTAIVLVIGARPVEAADALPRKTTPDLPIMAQLAAVDGLNAKLSGFGGWIDNDRGNPFAVPGFAIQRSNSSQAIFGGMGSVSIPLGQRFGLQIDGLASSARGAFAGGGAAHLFTRDPAVGLLGLYGSGFRNNAFNGFNRTKAGVEGELYFGRITLSGVAGWEQTRSSGTRFLGVFGGQNLFSVGATTNRFFNSADVSFYPVDNWRVSVGHRFVGGRHQAAIGTEYLFPLGGGTAAAAFVEGRIGGRDNSAIFGGLTVYFGQKDKTLIRRHREDDPPNRLLDDLYAGGSGVGANSNRGRRILGTPAANLAPPAPAAVISPPPPPPPPPPPLFCPCGPCGPCFTG